MIQKRGRNHLIQFHINRHTMSLACPNQSHILGKFITPLIVCFHDFTQQFKCISMKINQISNLAPAMLINSTARIVPEEERQSYPTSFQIR